MNKKTTIRVSIIIGISLFVGFLVGMEYTSYQVRSTISTVFTGNQDYEETAFEVEDANIIEKNIGEEIELATVKFMINEVSEAQIYNLSYSDPLVASEGAKFVMVNIDITNTTNESFYLSSGEFGWLIDDKDRRYELTGEYLGDKGVAGDLAPSIKKNGNIQFEVPDDSLSYSFNIGKAGTNDVYKVNLR